MDRNFFLDVGQDRQNHRAGRAASRYIFFFHEGHVSFTLFLAAETQEDSTAQLALGVGQIAKMEAGQIADSRIDATRIAPYCLHDGIELAGLSQQDPATELVQAVVRCDEPIQFGLTEHFLMPGPQRPQVMEASGAFEKRRIIGDDSATLASCDRFV